MSETNAERFERELIAQYRQLFPADERYVFSAAHTTPEGLAHKMTAGLRDGSASKDGVGIVNTCKALQIPHTYAAIRSYLTT